MDEVRRVPVPMSLAGILFSLSLSSLSLSLFLTFPLLSSETGLTHYIALAGLEL